MKNNLITGSLILLILANGWLIIFLETPFYKIDLSIIAISLIIINTLHGRFGFLYVIITVLSYGGFLTIYAFINKLNSDRQVQYIYDHLLVTSFLLIFWVFMSYVKSIGYENNDLRKQVAMLEKQDKNTSILTVPEFIYQGKWILNAVKRQGEAWFIRLDITYKSDVSGINLQEYLEKIVLSSVREQFDIVTATDDKIYFILKDTNKDGVQIVLNRMIKKAKSQLNLLELPYVTMPEQFVNDTPLTLLEEEIK